MSKGRGHTKETKTKGREALTVLDQSMARKARYQKIKKEEQEETGKEKKRKGGRDK